MSRRRAGPQPMVSLHRQCKGPSVVGGAWLWYWQVLSGLVAVAVPSGTPCDGPAPFVNASQLQSGLLSIA